MRLLLILFLASSFARAQSAVPEELKGLPERWEKAMKELRVPGAAICIIRDRKVWYRATFGVRDTLGRPVTDETAFYIASCTKPFVAMAVMQLVDAGKVSLDDPVKKHLPRFELADAKAAAALTVRDLLSHAKGLNCGPVVTLDAYTGEITEDRYYRLLAEAEPSGQPDYTNVHFTLAGRIIEAVTGTPWREYLKKNLFGPAGLRQATGYADAMYARDDVAIPMQWDDDGYGASPVRKTDRTMHAAGGLGISLKDMERWLLLNLSGGSLGKARLVSEASCRAMQTQQSELAAPRGSIRIRKGFGLGWIFGTYRGRTTYLEHGGGYTGAAANVSFMPEKGFGVGVLANIDGGGHALSDIVCVDVYDRLLKIEDSPDLVPGYVKRLEQLRARQRSQTPRGANPAEGDGLSLKAAAYAGTYAHDDFGTIRVWLDDGMLSMSLGDLKLALVTRGTDAFVGVAAPGNTNEGRFVVKEGRAVGIEARVSGRDVVFERR